MIVGDKLHRPSDALPRTELTAVAPSPSAHESPDLHHAGARSPVPREIAYAFGGGAVLTVLGLLLYALAAAIGMEMAGTSSQAISGLAAMAHGEQLAGLFLAGALGTFIAREFVVKPR